MKKIFVRLIPLITSTILLGAGCASSAPIAPTSDTPVTATSTPPVQNPAVSPTIAPPAPAKKSAQAPAPAPAPVPAPTPASKSFTITASTWQFSPSTIKVKKGDRVRLTVKSVDVAHGLAIKEFGVSAKLEAGETKTVEFAADKTGTFAMFCNVYCGDGHGGMQGTLVVE